MNGLVGSDKTFLKFKNLNLEFEKCELDNTAIDGMMIPLANTQKLESLNLSGNLFSDGLLLGQAIAENASLKQLNLSWNQFQTPDILKGLAENVSLTDLDLSYNGLTDSCAKAIMDFLTTNNVVESLNLKCNRLGLAAANAVATGLKVNQTLKVLNLSRNPFLGPGCLAIGTALPENPEIALELLDFSDITVGKEFVDLKLSEIFPNLKIITGGSWVHKPKKAPKMDPMTMLKVYMDQHGLRLVDFFHKLDTDGSMTLSRDEFKGGIQMAGIPMTETEIEALLDVLDRDGDGEINYRFDHKLATNPPTDIISYSDIFLQNLKKFKLRRVRPFDLTTAFVVLL